MRATTFAWVPVALTLAGCGSTEAGLTESATLASASPTMAPSAPSRSNKHRLAGVWVMSKETIAAGVARDRKERTDLGAPEGDSAEVERDLSQLSMEFAPGKLFTTDARGTRKEVAWQLVKETSETVTIRIDGDKSEQTFTFIDDDTVEVVDAGDAFTLVRKKLGNGLDVL